MLGTRIAELAQLLMKYGTGLSFNEDGVDKEMANNYFSDAHEVIKTHPHLLGLREREVYSWWYSVDITAFERSPIDNGTPEVPC